MRGLVLYLFIVVSWVSADEIVIKPHAIPGPCSVAQWKKDWPGCEWEDGVKEGHLSVVARGDGKAFRVDYARGQIGPENCGVGWRFPIGKAEVAQLTYTVRFGDDFDWVKGGKLPGLSGGPSNVSGGRPADGTNGFSARLMWRRDGRGEAYVYHKNQKGDYGDSFAFPEDFRFPTVAPIRVRMRVEMNEPGRKNGKLYVWIAMGEPMTEQLVVSRTNMEWRSVDAFAIDSLYFETFHGGSDKTWAPSRPCWAEFSGVKVATDP
ncbi:MAG: hypothetical protein KDK97_08265 [Verrucomicrobiales bacterium]|nr:hypothetical protein [Verrucomicrobiales bacterium]MCP5560554.1 hypothetical protein [Verrucomicrobiaceae bacterium]